MENETAAPLVYRVSADDRIVHVSPEWDRFAEENGGNSVLCANVLGRRLWQFILDPTTRQLYRDILTHVRQGHPVSFELRCDSPARRRLLKMTVTAQSEGGVEFQSHPLWVEERTPVSFPQTSCLESGAMLRGCGWCKRIQVGSEWLELETAIDRLGLFLATVPPQMSHGICERCHAAVMESIDSAR